jgi:hypothetical protein
MLRLVLVLVWGVGPLSRCPDTRSRVDVFSVGSLPGSSSGSSPGTEQCQRLAVNRLLVA